MSQNNSCAKLKIRNFAFLKIQTTFARGENTEFKDEKWRRVNLGAKSYTHTLKTKLYYCNLDAEVKANILHEVVFVAQFSRVNKLSRKIPGVSVLMTFL